MNKRNLSRRLRIAVKIAVAGYTVAGLIGFVVYTYYPKGFPMTWVIGTAAVSGWMCFFISWLLLTIVDRYF